MTAVTPRLAFQEFGILEVVKFGFWFLGGRVTLLIGRGPILVPGNLFWCFGFCLVFEGPRFGVPFGIFGFSCPMESLIPIGTRLRVYRKRRAPRVAR